MGKSEFLLELRRCLSQMPAAELEEQIAYYDELICDMMEEGISEQEAVAKLGEPSAIAAELLSELPLGTLVKTRVKPKDGWTAASIALIVLGSPLWLPILIAVGAVILALIITAASLIIALGAVVIALGASALGIVLGIVTGRVSGPPLLTLGVFLAAAGLCVLGALAVPPLARGLRAAVKALIRGTKKLFIKKEA